ncbi:MAG: hypothetical protein JW751_11065 [Polyangiaceae bacterium]|nr:hypothetical protein [Polyangiaceae bacterium]
MSASAAIRRARGDCGFTAAGLNLASAGAIANDPARSIRDFLRFMAQLGTIGVVPSLIGCGSADELETDAGAEMATGGQRGGDDPSGGSDSDSGGVATGGVEDGSGGDENGGARGGAGAAGGSIGGGGSGSGATGGAMGGAGGEGGGATGGDGSGATGGIVATGGGSSGGTGNADVCPGVEPPDPGYPTCRSQADCQASESCRSDPPTGAGLCGACLPTLVECDSDASCGAGSVCVTNPDPCQCRGQGTLCVPACTEDSCLPTEACAADGHCVPRRCEEGFECPADQLCAPDRGDEHGCAWAQCDLGERTCPEGFVCDPGSSLTGCRRLLCSEGATCPDNHRCPGDGDSCTRLSCTSDAECDCGACVNGTCMDRPYLCVLLPW